MPLKLALFMFVGLWSGSKAEITNLLKPKLKNPGETFL